MKKQPSCAGTGHPSMAGYGRMAPFELAGGPVKRLRTESPFPYLFAEEGMSGWCQTLLLDSQKSLLFLCKRTSLLHRNKRDF